MEKRFTAKTDDNSISEAPDRKTRLILVIVSGVLILGIGIAAATAVSARKKDLAAPTQTTETTEQTSTAESTNAPVTKFDSEYPEGKVPTDCMSLDWGMLPSEVKFKYPDVSYEAASTIADELNTLNLTYARKANIGGFEFSQVMISADKNDGLYAFSYFLDREKYSDLLSALTEEYGSPI